jgi:hypothetical protein
LHMLKKSPPPYSSNPSSVRIKALTLSVMSSTARRCQTTPPPCACPSSPHQSPHLWPCGGSHLPPHGPFSSFHRLHGSILT